MAKIKLKIATNKDKEEWDNLVELSPHGTIFHTWKWIKIIEKHTKSKLYPIIGFKGTEPIAIIPLFYQKKHSLKFVFSPPPHVAVPYLGHAFMNYDKIKQSKKESIFIDFQRTVDEFIKSSFNPDYVMITTSPEILDSRPLLWCDYDIKPLFTYIINLGYGAEHIWSGMKKKLRRDINNTEKEKTLSIRVGSVKEFRAIYNLVYRRYNEQKKHVSVSVKYLLDIYKSFHPKNLRIVVIECNGKIITGEIQLIYKDRITGWIGVPKTTFKNLSPNSFIQWESLKWAVEKGIKYYEELGANTERLCKYKSKFNPELKTYFSAKKANRKSKISESLYHGLVKPVYSKLKTGV